MTASSEAPCSTRWQQSQVASAIRCLRPCYDRHRTLAPVYRSLYLDTRVRRSTYAFIAMV